MSPVLQAFSQPLPTSSAGTHVRRALSLTLASRRRALARSPKARSLPRPFGVDKSGRPGVLYK
jgi:hypothetical protein